MNPSMTVRSFAELLHLPAYEYLRILYEQKYPRRGPNVFKIPYYHPAMSAIRRYWQSGNDARILNAAIDALPEDSTPGKKQHNARVIEAFRRSPHARRRLSLVSGPRVGWRIGSVDLRLSLDVAAEEAGDQRFLFLNTRQQAIGARIAEDTLELACRMMNDCGAACDPDEFEFIDLADGSSHKLRRLRPDTMRRSRKTAQVVMTLWPTIQP